MPCRSDTLDGVCREFGNACFIMASGGVRDMQLVERLASRDLGRRAMISMLTEPLGNCGQEEAIAD